MEERTSARSKGTNRVEVPEARGALDRFKFEVANEIGVDLKEGYNGHLTTAQAGSVGRSRRFLIQSDIWKTERVFIVPGECHHTHAEFV